MFSRIFIAKIATISRPFGFIGPRVYRLCQRITKKKILKEGLPVFNSGPIIGRCNKWRLLLLLLLRPLSNRIVFTLVE